MWSDEDCDRIVQAFKDPPPYGFSDAEKMEMLRWLNSPRPIWMNLGPAKFVELQPVLIGQFPTSRFSRALAKVVDWFQGRI